MKEIKDFIKKWCSLDEINFENIIKLGKEYYLVDHLLKKEVNKIKLEPYSIGLFLGENKQFFKPSLALLELVSAKTDKKVIVEDKSAWLFGCGRDLFDKSVNSNLNEFIVLNSKNDVFGWAKKIKKGKNILYKNMLDIGDYIRREKTRR